MKTLSVATSLCVLLLAGGTRLAAAEGLQRLGAISGKVTAEQPVQGVRVYARNADRHMTYMVYAVNGRYRALNVLPGTYEVTVEAPGFGADAAAVVVDGRETAAADFALRPVAEGTGRGEVVGSWASADDVALAPYDEIYPPGAARDTLERTCITCHGVNWIPQRTGLDEAGWNGLIELMMTLDDSVWGVDAGTPMIPPGTISPAERKELATYLGRHFGPGKAPRMVLNDESMALDEAALAKAMWIEYTVAQPKSASGEHRWIQEPYFDREGNVWYTERTRNAPAILKLDPRTATFIRYPLPDPGWSPHGIVADPVDGSIWWAGRGVDVARLDPATGETTAYGDTSSPQRWGGHTPVFDSKGDLWYSMIAADRIGRWDRESDRITHWDIPTKGGRPYGILVDHQDDVWFATFHNCRVTRFDPDDEAFREYVSPSNPCTLRRLGLDSKGTIWYGVFSGGMLGRLDPDSGKMTEYRIARFSEPYEAWADPDDNIWMADGGQGGMLIRFDPRTERFTSYPSPMQSDKPKMAITRDGAIWYSNRSIAASGRAPATVGVLYPDVSLMTTLGAYYAVQDGRAVGSGSPAPASRR